MTRRFTVLAVVALGLGIAVSAASGADRPARPAQQRMSSELALVLRAELDNGRGLAVARAKGLQVVGARVRVVIEANGSRAAVSSAVRGVGATFEAWHAGLAQALVAPRALGPLSKASAVAYIRAPRRLAPQ